MLSFMGVATVIALLAGLLYMFHSALGFLSLLMFLIRGAVTDILFLD